MNCIVTAGPTYEPLDCARRLTNFSTGKLGVTLANYLAARGHQALLLVGEMASYAGERKMQRIEVFSTTADLRKKLKLLPAGKVDAVFHAAAVSDFSFGKIFEPSGAGRLSEIKSRKLSTQRGKLLAELLPTPKIIAELRGWFPKAKIIGWKYEADGTCADAISTGRKQIAVCATDLCVVNGPAYGKGFGLLGKTGAPAHFQNPPKLFRALEKFLRQ